MVPRYCNVVMVLELYPPDIWVSIINITIGAWPRGSGADQVGLGDAERDETEDNLENGKYDSIVMS